MSGSGNKHQDQLIENALALLQEAVRKEPFDVKDILPPAQFGSAETNVVVTTQHPDGHRSVVAASSVAIVMGHEPEQHRASPASPDLEHQPEEAAAPKPTDIVERTLSIMRTASEELKTASSSPVSAKMPGPNNWLDMERAATQRRVEAFKATQQRFQRERERYCAATLDAAKAGDWRPQQS